MRSLLVVLLLCPFLLHAQQKPIKHVIKLDPARTLLYKFNLEYEYLISNRFSIGATADLYYLSPEYDLFNYSKTKVNTFKAGIWGRFYFSAKKHKGFYAQAKFAYATFKDENTRSFIDIRHYEDSITVLESTIISRKKSFLHSHGLGLGLGYHALLGKHFSLDMQLEFQLISPPYKPDTEIVREQYYDTNNNFVSENVWTAERQKNDENLDWYLSGPGAFIFPSIKIGYAF